MFMLFTSTNADPVSSGLSRLEYRGYDSAGIAIDGDKKNEVYAFKEVGKVEKLKQLIEEAKPDPTFEFDSVSYTHLTLPTKRIV